jgi:hypothetical protein
MIPLKNLTQIAREFTYNPKTFFNKIRRHPTLSLEIESGLQPPRKQKLLYDEFGYPPGVNKSDYDNV